MAVTIKLKNASGSDPSASDLVVGEVAIRTDNGKLFTKKDNGTVAEISGGSGGIDDGDKGDITVSNGGDTFTIDSNAITTAKIANDAVTGAKIAAEIDNSHITSSAAIAGTKISPNFGSQNIVTTGNLDVDGTCDLSGKVDCQAGLETDGDVILNSTTTNVNVTFDASDAALEFTDNAKATFGDGADLQIFHTGNNSVIRDNGTGNLYLQHGTDNKLQISNTGITITGSVVVSGTVDGRDLATDGTKLDGIESGATADQSASEILTLIKTVDGAGSGLDADTLDGISSASFVRSDADDTLNGQYTISDSANEKLVLAGSTNPYIRFQEGTTDKGYIQWNSNGYLRLVNQEDSSQLRIQDDIKFSQDGSTFYKVWHENNDGSSSGLDSDLLDGQHGSHYLDYNNFSNTPTIPTNNNQLTNGAGYVTSNTQLSNEQVQDIVGGMVSGNSESGITVTYQDSDGTLDFSVASQTDQNFTTTLKNKLDGIASGATNVTNNNQLTNGAGYVTANTQLSNEQVQDIVGGMVSGNTESGITVTYQDSDGTLDFAVSSSGISEDTGSWTPTVTFGGGSSGQSYSIRVGRYVKLGSLVHIQCHVEFSDKGSSSGTAKIAGLPFTIRNGTNDFPSAVMAFKDHGSSSSGPGSISSFMVFGDPNNTTLDIAREQLNDSTSEMNDATNGNFADNTQFMLTMTYVAA